ncbi:MAG: hypothetical protein ACK4JF_03535, partial [Methylohalobius sp.]
MGDLPPPHDPRLLAIAPAPGCRACAHRLLGVDRHRARARFPRGDEEQLKVHIYALLSALELDRQGQPKLPEALPEPRFASPGSGL